MLEHDLLLNYNGFCGILDQMVITDKPLKIGRKLHQALADYSEVKWHHSLSEFRKAVEIGY